MLGNLFDLKNYTGGPTFSNVAVTAAVPLPASALLLMGTLADLGGLSMRRMKNLAA